MKFYFTYGQWDAYPYQNGWSEVIADNENQAVDLFVVAHGRLPNGCVPCAGIYSEEEFKRTGMYASDNFGARCHEVISLNIDIKIVG